MDPISTTAPDLAGRPLLSQLWRDLVFLHWRVEPREVAPLLPPGIEPDVVDGTSWIGLIPFSMAGTAVLGGPRIPYLGTFTEVNVRLYGVDRAGRRGVVFASLEASRLLAVLGARAVFGLPYFWADATHARQELTDAARLDFRSRRHAPGHPSTAVVARVSAPTAKNAVTDDPVADFLTARWLLFQRRGRATLTLPNRHESWRLYRAEVEHLDDGLVAAAGIRSIGAREPDSVLWSPGVDTDFGAPLR